MRIGKDVGGGSMGVEGKMWMGLVEVMMMRIWRLEGKTSSGPMKSQILSVMHLTASRPMVKNETTRTI